MKQFVLISSCIIFFLPTVFAQTTSEQKQATTDITSKLFVKYTLPVYGINNTKDLQNLSSVFLSKNGIIFTYINPKSYELTVIAKDYITIENVIDILRFKGCKTDTYTSLKINQQEADDAIKKINSVKE